MENAGICITMRKDGRYMGKFVTGYGDDHKAQYDLVESFINVSKAPRIL